MVGGGVVTTPLRPPNATAVEVATVLMATSLVVRQILLTTVRTVAVAILPILVLATAVVVRTAGTVAVAPTTAAAGVVAVVVVVVVAVATIGQTRKVSIVN